MDKQEKLRAKGCYIYNSEDVYLCQIDAGRLSPDESKEMATKLVDAHNSHPALVEDKKKLVEALEKSLEPLVRYGSCLHGYAKESAHKGNRSNLNHWTTKVKANAELIKEIKAALASIKGGE